MRKFLLGLACGLVLGFAGTAVASVHIVGDKVGFLMGWTVTKDGNEICDDPYVWSVTKEIDCN